MQHAIIAQLRAMEHNRYYIRAANDGLTCVIDPYGRIVQQIPLFKRGVLKGQLSIETRPKTFYTKHGDWLLVVLSAIIGLFFLIGIFNRQRFGNRKKIDIV